MDTFEDFKTPPILDNLKSMLNQREEEIFSPAATYSASGQRRHPIIDSAAGYRQAFSLDADRILHSRGYARYIDKTQVFYLIKNDHGSCMSNWFPRSPAPLAVS